jgi:Pyridine nucleotide-disulphide oxidoreductase
VSVTETPQAQGPSTVVDPWDESNRALVANVHPADWVNPTPAGRYNLVVIGAGTAGLVTAIGAAGLGARVALIERELMGGDCLNVGCVPSKALIRAARAWADVRDAATFGVEVPPGARVDFPAVMARMRRLRAAISRNDSAQRYQGLGVDVFFGAGRFTGSNTVEVADRILRFKRAVIATGARAAAPVIPGLASCGVVSNVELPCPGALGAGIRARHSTLLMLVTAPPTTGGSWRCGAMRGDAPGPWAAEPWRAPSASSRGRSPHTDSSC